VFQQTVNGFALGATYALLGLGVTLIWGVLRVLNFAYGQFITWGAFGTLVALETHQPAVIAVPIGMAVAGVLAVVVDGTVLSFMRRRHSSEFALVVATIGASYLLSTIAQWRSHSQTEAFPIDRFPHGSIHLGGTALPTLQLLTLGISVAVMIGLGYWLNRTKLGRATRTVAYSAETAELLGVNSRAIYALAVFVSGCLAALAGAFNSAVTATLSYSSGDQLLVVAFAVIVLGGMGSVPGAVVGGLLLGLVQVYTTVYVSGVFSQAITYLVIVAVLIVRPFGLFGVREEARV
jgi:branched-chain amino acid transport system permease protein